MKAARANNIGATIFKNGKDAAKAAAANLNNPKIGAVAASANLAVADVAPASVNVLHLV